MPNSAKITISKKIAKDFVVAVEVETTGSIQQAVKEAAEAINIIKKK